MKINNPQLKLAKEYYIQFRYPPEIKSYSKEECKTVLETAEKMAQFVINKII